MRFHLQARMWPREAVAGAHDFVAAPLRRSRKIANLWALPTTRAEIVETHSL